MRRPRRSPAWTAIRSGAARVNVFTTVPTGVAKGLVATSVKVM
jgi:hypothetical protein